VLLKTQAGLVRDIAVPILAGEAGIARVGISQRRSEGVLADLRRSFLALAVLVLAVGALVAAAGARLTTRPLRSLAAAATAVGAGDWHREVAIPGDDEVATLGRAFNSMLAQLRESRARLEEHAAHLEEQARELRALYQTGKALNRTLDARQVIETALDEALEVSEAAAGWAFVHTCDAGGGPLFLSRGLSPAMAAEEELQGRQGCVCEDVMETGEVRLLDDMGACRGLSREALADCGLACHVAIPLLAKGQVVGVMNLASPEPAHFKTRSLEFFRGLGEEVGLALENARLFDEVRDELRRREELQQQLIHSAKLAAIGTLAAGVAHELNQPLTVVRALAQELRACGAADEDMATPLADIENQTSRMIQIIEHLRTVSRDARSEKTPVRINEVVREALSMVGQQLRNRGVELILELGNDLPGVTANATQIEQVVLNLLTNARDALEGHPAPRVCVRTWESQDGGGELHAWVVIEVADNGPGIPAELRDRVFEPFFTTKEASQGTGLGLAVSHGIVTDHGGRLQLVTGDNSGTTFRVWLPCRGCRVPSPIEADAKHD